MKFYALFSLALLGLAAARPSEASAQSLRPSVTRSTVLRSGTVRDDDDDSDSEKKKLKKQKKKHGRALGHANRDGTRNGDMCWDRNRNGYCDDVENGNATRTTRDDRCVDGNRDGRCDDILTSGSSDVLGAILRGGRLRLR